MEHIEKRFAQLGFPVEILTSPKVTGRGGVPYRIDVVTDKKGKEKFKIELDDSRVELQVLDTNAAERALVLMVKYDDVKIKALCGHDERQLFTAAASESITTVLQAKDGLKPPDVKSREAQAGVKKQKVHKHRNKARVRQGDFFFLPVPNKIIPENLILRDEPINRGRGRSHMVEELYREGGETVMVSSTHRNGVTLAQHEELMKSNGASRFLRWTQRQRGARVFARGRITHGQHVTVVLKTWHEVVPNTEAAQRGFSDMAFLD